MIVGNIIISWEQFKLNFFQSDTVKAGQKRHTPITFGNGSSPNKRTKDDGKTNKRELYTPPSGKYSSNISSNYGKC